MRVYVERFEVDAMRHVSPRAEVLHVVVEHWAREAGYRVSGDWGGDGVGVMIYVEVEDETALIAEWAIAGRPGAYVPNGTSR